MMLISNKMNVRLALNKKHLACGIKTYIEWNLEQPHALITGVSGSGKTYFSKLFLARIVKTIPESEIIICDFKGDKDFDLCKGNKNFYRFHECMEGLKRALLIMQERQQENNADRHPVIFFFDEWASFIASLEKKESELVKRQYSQLLMLGRSFSITCINATQRAMAEYYGASRDNFAVKIGLGKLSKESISMLFDEYKDEIEPNQPQGEGYAIVGNLFYEIVVPKIGDMGKVEQAIVEGLSRYQ